MFPGNPPGTRLVSAELISTGAEYPGRYEDQNVCQSSEEVEVCVLYDLWSCSFTEWD